MSKETKREPVKYTVLEKSCVGNEIFEAGQTCEYAGLPSENLEPQCDIGRARYQEYLDSNAARVAKMKADNAESGVGDVDTFAKAVSKAMAEANAAADAKFNALAETMKSLADTMTVLAKAQGGKGGKAAAVDSLA